MDRLSTRGRLSGRRNRAPSRSKQGGAARSTGRARILGGGGRVVPPSFQPGRHTLYRRPDEGGGTLGRGGDVEKDFLVKQVSVHLGWARAPPPKGGDWGAGPPASAPRYRSILRGRWFHCPAGIAINGGPSFGAITGRPPGGNRRIRGRIFCRAPFSARSGPGNSGPAIKPRAGLGQSVRRGTGGPNRGIKQSC